MEIKLIVKQRFMIWAGSILSLLVFIASCSDKEMEPGIHPRSKQSIEARISKGDFLNKVSEGDGVYIFQFEGGDMEVPAIEIESVHPNREQWQTIVFFVDGSQIKVPTIGDNLDFIVKNTVLNPSGFNPLSAMVSVDLPSYGRVKVTVHGKNGETGTVSHLCNARTPKQQVPILGLYADHANRVDLTYTSTSGRELGTAKIVIHTESLPVTDFPRQHVVKAEHDQMEPGMNLMNYPGASVLDLSVPYIVDSEGEIRWIVLWNSSPDLKDISISAGLERIANGNFIAGDQNGHRIVEFDMFGNFLRQWDLQGMGYTFHHDVTETSNGNFLITVSKINAQLANGQPRVQDFIIEIDSKNGSLKNEWDLATMVDTTRYLKPDGITPPEFSQTPTNWAHNNSVTKIGNDLLVTMRYQGIASFTPEGRLQWIIAPHKDWKEEYRPYLLDPVDEDGLSVNDVSVIEGDSSADRFDWSWGPHTPIALSDDRILVFDNGYNRHGIPNRLAPQNNYSRVVEYKINKEKNTVQQIWSYGKDRGAEGFSQAVSGVQYLPDTGNILFCPGMGVPTSIGLGGRIVEIDPKTNKVVFELEVATSSNMAFHRATRIPLYPKGL